jgi:hypothetical protein
MTRKRVTVCGLKVSVSDAKSYGGGHLYPGARDIGTTAHVSKATAQKLAKGAGAARTPRLGYELKLCEHMYLENVSGTFRVIKRASGGLSGRRTGTR